jgi:uncharacterized membrane protein YphA (DoxX/SURF4 family)
MAQSRPDLAKPVKKYQTMTFWSIFFLAVLRIAIGWHFFYEGAYKLVQEDWRATSYLVASAGPLRDFFRSELLVDDVDGLRAMTPESVYQRLDERADVMIDHFGITDPELAQSIIDYKKMLQEERIPAVFTNPELQKQIADYKVFLKEIHEQEDKLGTMKFETERLTDMYRRKAAAKASIMHHVEAPLRELHGFVMARMEEPQLAAGPTPGETSPTWFADIGNKWGLTIVGACLMLGLFTRLAALGGIGLLALYYLAMPPFPGLPENPMAEGHYLIVNKNLIEAIALMVIGTSRIGRWFGLDAFIAKTPPKPAEPPRQEQQGGRPTGAPATA